MLNSNPQNVYFLMQTAHGNTQFLANVGTKVKEYYPPLITICTCLKIHEDLFTEGK